MGIPGNAIKEWRDEYEISDTDGIEQIINTSEANKREQAELVLLYNYDQVFSHVSHRPLK
jgi:hypothetical protein